MLCDSNIFNNIRTFIFRLKIKMYFFFVVARFLKCSVISLCCVYQ